MYHLLQKSFKYKRFCTKYRIFRIKYKNFQQRLIKKKLSTVKSFVVRKVTQAYRAVRHIHYVNADGYGDKKIKPLPSSRVKLYYELLPIPERDK